MTRHVAVGIDIGGTGTRFVGVEPATGEVLCRRVVPTPRSPSTALAFLHEHVGEVIGDRHAVGLGVGASGPVDATGVVRNPDTLPAFTDLPIIDLIADLIDGPIVVDNDAVCAALAERAVGAARWSRRSLHVTLGTGVGVCLLDGDSPFRLLDGTHPEGGHIAVALTTTPCYCGRPACWEQAASRRTLQNAAARILDRPGDDAGVLDDLAALAVRKDSVASTAFQAYGTSVAAGLATLLTLYGPDLVVVGGSAARHLPLYRESLQSALDALGAWIPDHQITATHLDDYGGAIGGAHLALAALHC